jgi:RimJ/RimL family protein N-acetyltransferase
VQKVDTLISVIHPDNFASIRVAEKIGERYEQRAIVNGFDAFIYRIDRDSR